MTFEQRQMKWGIVVGAAVSVPVLWDFAGLDLLLASLMGGSSGFSGRNDWWLKGLLHKGGRQLAWSVEILLCLLVIWPIGPFKRLSLGRRAQLALSVLLSTALVATLKSFNFTSCPWDLQVFGGVASHQSHWVGWWTSDGGPGRCFPAGHASAGFGFLGGWFALRRDLPRWATAWLVMAAVFGLSLGIAQQLRGAHFMSHTLWTAWFCLAVGWLLDASVTALKSGKPVKSR